MLSTFNQIRRFFFNPRHALLLGITPGELIDDLVPKFFYTSHYDRMSGQLSAKAIAEQQNIGNFKPEDKIFLDFLRLAGTSLDELNQSPRYEELNAKCEAASADITEQIFEYWSQNDHLKVEVRLSEGRKEDPPPFHSGAVARARIFNNLHQVSVAFSERSAGFVWFFSFLVQFTMMRRDASNVILLLDEPGLTLHGKAQADLLHYIEAELLPKYQIIYTAHSPFMVPTSRLVDCRIVEDIQMRGTNSRVYSEGTRISEDVLSTDKDTLFPLQGALGYSVTQSLFVGENTLLVEGPSDILYLSALSNEIEKRGGTSLNPKWTLCPAGGIDNIKPFLSLFVGNELNIAVLTDKVQGDKSKIERIRQSEILSRERFHTFAELLDKGEGEIEDVFEPELFCIIINNAYELNAEHKITPEKLNQYSKSIRQAKRIEKHFNTLPDHIPEFNHYRPAEWLIRNGTILSKKSDAVDRTLETAENIFAIYNKLL